MCSAFLIIAGASLWLACTSQQATSSSAKSARKPNVLLIIADDLRPTLGCYGDELALTPSIDSLAQDGVLFTNAHAQQALCGPSRTSFLTSRRPDTLRVYENHCHYWRHTVGNFSTIPQYFKENGYHTVSVGKVFHPGPPTGHHLDYPYSWSVKPFTPKSLYFENKEVCPDPSGTPKANLLCAVNVSTQPLQTLPDLQNVEVATKFLREWPSREGTNSTQTPFFLAVGFYKPHVPFRIPKEYLDLYPIERIRLPPDHELPVDLPLVAWNPWTDVRRRHDASLLNVSFPYGPLPVDFQKEIRRHYYAAVTYMDKQVGRVLIALDEAGLRNDTLIVFVGDHGWSLGEHQEYSKFSNFQVATNVPLIVSPPRSQRSSTPGKAAERVDDPVALVDLFPTLASLASLPVPPSCQSTVGSSQSQTTCTDGVNLVHPVERKEVLHQYPRPSATPQENSDQPVLGDIRIMGYSMLSRDYRYTEWIGFDTTNFRRNWTNVYARELYNLSLDSREDSNVAGSPEYKDVVVALSSRLRELVGS
ncbi:iduronate 2-sulfatase [Dermacentor andersoni]|uniref:iduronate 2-sulfatase n=1 Tax=Dermacentor andersoni TaxID=34620 RepID=UPI002155F038|nr:iduronate 2-sulfatase-like [Dermacentor andersoni]XP_054929644.1 iduronate 2-sulfatase-like [Dermacentor andersoni]XP_054929645.1 iduronate 2-sulfatase-like [Dermacentor andersoni]